MTKENAIDLLNNLDFDDDAKQVFLLELESSLFEQHTDFLFNPLLLSMMLLTFSQFSDIPNKIHIFYQQAFEVLFQRHDRSKGGAFTQKHHTDMPIDVFQRVFSYFCASSYLAERMSFMETEVIELAGKSLRYEKVDTDGGLLLKDLTESTCLLQEDGLEYTFVHRSFQEYFTAIFLSKLHKNDLIRPA